MNFLLKEPGDFSLNWGILKEWKKSRPSAISLQYHSMSFLIDVLSGTSDI